MPNNNLVETNIPNRNQLVKNSLETKSKIFRILFVFVFLVVIFLSSNTITAYASDRYWIGGTGNWSDTAHWSDSDGGTGGFSVPTSADNVFFSAGSFSINGAVVTLDTTANTANLNFSGLDQTMTLTSSVNTLNVSGSLALSTNLTVTFTSTAYLYLIATTSVGITSNGFTGSFNRTYMDGVGGKWILQDDMISSFGNPWYFVNGEFDTNNKNITKGAVDLSWRVLPGIKKLTLGSSVITLGNGIIFPTSDAGLTIDAGTSTIKQTGDWFEGGGKTYYNIELNKAFTIMGGTVGNFTCNNLIRTSGNNINGNLPISSNITITNNLNFTGYNNSNARLLVSSSTIGTQRTITVDPAKVTASNVDFRDIRFANPIDLSGISGGSGDAGGNSGITFTPAQPQYFKHTSGAVNWSDSTKWFSDISPRTTPGRVPLPQDDATFDASSFTGASTLTVNVPRIGRSLDMSGVNQAVTFSLANAIESYGSYVLGNNITPSGNYIIYLYGRGNYNLNTYNKLIYKFELNNLSSNKYTNQSDIQGQYVSVKSGIFDYNDFNSAMSNYIILSYGGTTYLGNGILQSTSSIITDYVFYSAGTIFAEGSTVKINYTGSSNLNFNNAGKTFNKVQFSGSHTGNFDVTGSNTIAELIVDPGRKVRFTAGTTQQIGKLTANGTVSNPITIGSITGASHTLNYTGATNAVGDYLNISYSNATPANKWYASNSINSGNNTGWTFANSPDAPTGLTPTAGNAQVALSWTAPIYNGGIAITDYVVEYKLTTDSTWSIFADAISTLTTATIVGLTNSRSYDFRVYAVNNVGQGTASATTSATPFSPNDRYWVGGTGNWSDTSHWANVDGGAGGQSVPTSTNDVYFSAGSFSTNGAVVSLDVVANTKSLDFFGIDQTVTFSSSVNSINIYGALTLPATNLTWTFTGTAYTYLKATASVNITMGATTGRNFNRLYFDGVGGTWTLQDEMNIIGNVYLSNGTFNLNNLSFTTNGLFDILTGTKTLTLGSGTLIAERFRNNSPTNFTFNYNTGTIWLKSRDVNAELIGANTFYNLKLESVSGFGIIAVSGNQTINNNLTFTGLNVQANRLLIASTVIGTQRTITVDPAKVTATNVDFRDIKFQNVIDLSAISGGSGDAGGNSGITFTPAQPQYFKHTSGAVNWSDSTKWFSDQAKTIPGRVPLPQDDATFDASSFTGASTLTVNVPRIGRSLDMSGVNQPVTFTLQQDIESYGSFIFGNNLTRTGNYTIYLMGRSSFNFDSYSKSFYRVNFNGYGSTYTNLSALNFSNSLYVYNGTFIHGNFTSNIYAFVGARGNIGSGIETVDFTNATIILTGFNGYIWVVAKNQILTGSTIKLVPSSIGSSPTQIQNLSSINNFNKFWISGTSSQTVDFVNGGNFNELIIDPGRQTRFTAGSTSNIGKLTANGTASNPIMISSVSGATHTLNYTGTTNAVGDYLYISYSNATPANKWYASNSTNGGNNTGWVFAESPDAPTAVGASVGDSQVSLSWSPPAYNGGTAITDYAIEYKLTSEPTVWSIFSDGVNTNTTGIVTGLTNGSSYDFRIRAINLIGQGAESNTITATPLTTPGVPINIVATRLNASASITFTPPTSDGGSPITSYTVTSSPESHTEIGSASPIIVTGLTNSTAYTFTVTATNIAGTGPASSNSNSVTPATIPDAPTELSGIAGNAQVELSWIAPVWNGGSNIIDYVIEYKLSGEPTIWSLFADGVNTNTTVIITGLTNAQSYDFRIYAVNDVGQGSSSIETSATPITVPDAPTAVTGIAGNAEVTVSFTPPAFNGGSTINSYKMTSSPGNFTATASASPLTITGLTNGTAYTFTVTATNAVGEGLSSIPSDSITPVTVPDAPTAVIATEGNRQASVSFTPPVFNGGTPITSYTVTSNPGIITATGGASPIIVTGLTNGTTYTFTVKATNVVGSGGNSSPSNEVTLSTEPLAPINLASTVLGSSIGLSWSPPTSNGGSAIIDYVIEYKLSTGGEWAIFADGTNTNTTAIVNGLSNRTSYDFRVSAQNIIGQSTPSSTVSATPGEPAQVLVQNISNLNLPNITTAVRITNEGALDYEYQYNWCITDSSLNLCGGGNDVFNSSAAKLIESEENWDTDLVSTVLTPGDYYFHIKVLYGSESSNAYQSFTALATYPDTPTVGVAIAGDRQASVSFTPSVFNGGSPITNYTATSMPGGLTGTSTTSPIIVTGLTNGNSYTFNVTATNTIGTSSASDFSNSITPVSIPDSPTSLSAIAGNMKVDLSWIAPIYNGGSEITDYIIEYKLITDPTWSVFSDGISTITTTVVTGLTNNLSYDFRVSAVNIVGQSSVNNTNATLPANTSKRTNSGYYIPPTPKIPPQIEQVEETELTEPPLENPVRQDLTGITKSKSKQVKQQDTNTNTDEKKIIEVPKTNKIEEDMNKNDNEIRVTPTEKSSSEDNSNKDSKILKSIMIYGGGFVGGLVLLFIIFRIVIFIRKNSQ